VTTASRMMFPQDHSNHLWTFHAADICELLYVRWIFGMAAGLAVSD